MSALLVFNSPQLIRSQLAVGPTVNPFRPIIRPPVAAIKCVKVFDISVEPLLGVLGTTLFEPEICEDTEPKPIRIGHATLVSEDGPFCSCGRTSFR